MLPVGLFLRFCFIFSLAIILAGCSASSKSVSQTSGGTGWQSEMAVAKLCPAYLLNPDLYYNQEMWAIEQSRVAVYCDLEKDGTLVFGEQTQPQSSVEQPVWLLVDTDKLQIDVKRGEQTLASFPNIAIGQNGAGFKKRRGDNITPLGEYKIGWINDRSQFYIFYGLTYPSVANAEEAMQRGLISQEDYSSIIYAHEHNQIPPQNTALGGQIGLHGLGRGDEVVHQNVNWTHGCVAVTNSQLDELAQWLTTGMTVKIK